MPRIYKGEKWEVQFRKQVRTIKDGLTASKNGRGPIKATQLILKDSKDSNKSISCWAKNLPWTKKDKDRNLKIIRDAINRMDQSINLSLKSAINLSAHHYDLAVLTQTQPTPNKQMKTPNKQEWIKEEHQKAVQVHWDNLDRIRKLETKIKNQTRKIALIQKSIDLIENVKFGYEEMDHYTPDEQRIFAKCDHTPYWEHDENSRIFAGNYDVGVEELHIRQKQICAEVVKCQQEIDKHTFDESVAIMHRDGDEAMLADKYDELYVKEAG